MLPVPYQYISVHSGYLIITIFFVAGSWAVSTVVEDTGVLELVGSSQTRLLYPRRRPGEP